MKEFLATAAKRVAASRATAVLGYPRGGGFRECLAVGLRAANP